jgi:hypothetical protein
MTESKVVDAWAIIAWVLDQAAAPAVESFLQEAELHLLMSWINVGDVFPNDTATSEPRTSSIVSPLFPFARCFQTKTQFSPPARSRPPIPSRTAMPSRSHWPNRKKPASSPATMKSAKRSRAGGMDRRLKAGMSGPSRPKTPRAGITSPNFASRTTACFCYPSGFHAKPHFKPRKPPFRIPPELITALPFSGRRRRWRATLRASEACCSKAQRRNWCTTGPRGRSLHR